MIEDHRVVAIGGGHGLAVTLAAARTWTAAVTAVVTVGDDGGSSGRLRQDFGIIAPGDIRRCIQSLAPPGLLNDALGHRFDSGDLEGHPPGNLMLAGLLQRTGDPVAAVDTLAVAAGVVGRVLPSSVEPVDLVAETANGRIYGQVAIGGTTGITGLGWTPPHPRVPRPALDAIAGADLVVLGPGSLFTSVLAAVVPAVRDAVAETSARVIYVSNLSSQQPETRDYSVADHVRAVLRHGVTPDAVLADESAAIGDLDHRVELVRARLRDRDEPGHDIVSLASALRGYAAVTVSANQDRIP